ncbi:MAG: hypothetical protein V1912_03220 [bacterium]
MEPPAGPPAGGFVLQMRDCSMVRVAAEIDEDDLTGTPDRICKYGVI